jgi:hypothetical protein
MDPKLAAILMKAKAVDTATAQKNGETRKPTRKAAPVNRDYFNEPEMEYLTEAPTHTPTGGGGGGLFDQMGVSGGGPSGGGPSTPSVVDRMDVNSAAYESSVNNSNLPPAIMKAMLDSPIPMGEGVGGTEITEEFMNKINPNMGRTQVPELPQVEQYDSYDEEDEGEYYSHPIQEQQVRPREIPNTQRRVVEHTEVGESEIRKMIAQEIAKALPVVIEQYFDKRVLKENVSFKAGNTTFSGTVSPLPKKRTKKKRN